MDFTNTEYRLFKNKCSGGSRGGGRPPYFWTKLKPEGPKKIFGETTLPPLSKGLDDRVPPPLSQGLDPVLKCVVINDVQKCEQDECFDSAAP